MGIEQEKSVSRKPPSNKLPSVLPELVGKRFGKLTVITGEIVRVKGRPYVMTRCDCGIEALKAYCNLAKEAGCRKCGQPTRFPRWLFSRCTGAQQRCQNPNNNAYYRYGERGIEFRFESVAAMALWVQENLGLHRDMYLDRIDNDGHYEAGNLRYVTNRQNCCNTRATTVAPEVDAFRLAHPEIRYSETAIGRFLRRGLTWDQIIERHAIKRTAPRGPYKGKKEYSICSTPDPAIASLHQAS